MNTDLPTARFPALGTTAVVVVTDADALPAARTVIAAEIAALDAACSRFRPDSEIVTLAAARGRPQRISATLAGALAVALRSAAETDGLVDPTIGRALRLLGYDRDFDAVADDGPPLPLRLESVPGWRAVHLDLTTSCVTVPIGVELDLGATAKAWCADRAAALAAERTRAGVLVSLGGDIAVAGPAPCGGWVVRLSDRHDDPGNSLDPTVVITSGGLATSGTTARRWRRGGEELHHIVDPATSRSAVPCWRTVSVAAATCAGANAASTAAILLGDAAPTWLADRRLPARLVGEDGVVVVAGWPADALADAEPC